MQSQSTTTAKRRLNCTLCGVEFVEKRSQSSQLYCSMGCYRASLKHPELGRGGRRVVKCERCDASFEAHESAVERGRRFCSEVCYLATRAERSTQFYDALTKPCEHCGGPFTRSRTNRRIKFCSASCYAEHRAERRVGPKKRSRRNGIKVGDRMYEDQGGLCAYCEAPLGVYYEVEHMTPLSRGGTDHWSNVAVACMPCNRSKGSMTTEEFMGARTA